MLNNMIIALHQQLYEIGINTAFYNFTNMSKTFKVEICKLFDNLQYVIHLIFFFPYYLFIQPFFLSAAEDNHTVVFHIHNAFCFVQ